MKIKQLFDTRYFMKKAGQIPGHIPVGKITENKSRLEIIRYTPDKLEHQNSESEGDIVIKSDYNNWVRVLGLDNGYIVKQLGEQFNVHSLILEDVLNTDHLPKIEFSQHHLFFTLKLPVVSKDEFLEFRHVSLIVGSNYLITVQEGEKDLFAEIVRRMEEVTGRIREKSIMYLFYSVIDYIVDHYFHLMDNLREEIENEEDKIVEDPSVNHISEIQDIKKQLVLLRKYVNSLNKAVYKLINEENKFIDRPLRLFFNDIYDHIIHLNEQLNTFKELQVTLLEINMANINNSMNHVMKTLTVIASIFIPLTFIAGIYGMNFTKMPELEWTYGYTAALGLMLIVAATMLIFMK
ncbi:MAG: magnesium/cobalt transporter CorA, partial [Bacteroidales bacterium]